MILNSIYFVPVLVVTLVVLLIGGFNAYDKLKLKYKEYKHKKLSRLKMSQCEACRDYHLWYPGDTIYYQIDQKETGVGDLISFHPEKVIVKASNNKELLIAPYLIVENETAQLRKHKIKSKNFLAALDSDNSDKFLPENTQTQQTHVNAYS